MAVAIYISFVFAERNLDQILLILCGENEVDLGTTAVNEAAIVNSIALNRIRSIELNDLVCFDNFEGWESLCLDNRRDCQDAQERCD